MRRMPKFVIERDVPGAGALSPEQLRDVSLRSLEALGELGPRIQWLHSFVTDDKVYCVYLASDEETIRTRADSRSSGESYLGGSQPARSDELRLIAFDRIVCRRDPTR